MKYYVFWIESYGALVYLQTKNVYGIYGHDRDDLVKGGMVM